MPDYDNTNAGSLWKNDKQGVETRPDYRGNLNVAGTEYWISAWLKVSGPNSKTPSKKFMSLLVQPKKVMPGSDGLADLDDDIPF